jgi:hypothetical protein
MCCLHYRSVFVRAHDDLKQALVALAEAGFGYDAMPRSLVQLATLCCGNKSSDQAAVRVSGGYSIIM